MGAQKTSQRWMYLLQFSCRISFEEFSVKKLMYPTLKKNMCIRKPTIISRKSCQVMIQFMKLNFLPMKIILTKMKKQREDPTKMRHRLNANRTLTRLCLAFMSRRIVFFLPLSFDWTLQILFNIQRIKCLYTLLWIYWKKSNAINKFKL